MRQLKNKADFFDIVLFKTNTKAAKLVRGYTHSEYDHVGLLLPQIYNTFEPCILESTGGKGVHITTLAAYIP